MRAQRWMMFLFGLRCHYLQNLFSQSHQIQNTWKKNLDLAPFLLWCLEQIYYQDQARVDHLVQIPVAKYQSHFYHTWNKMKGIDLNVRHRWMIFFFCWIQINENLLKLFDHGVLIRSNFNESNPSTFNYQIINEKVMLAHKLWWLKKKRNYDHPKDINFFQ